MTTLRPPPNFKRQLSDLEATKAAQAAMRSPMGQRALRERWGRGLYQYVIAWGTTPVELRTIEALKRAANEFEWDLREMRNKGAGDALQAKNLSLMETAASFEDELSERYLEMENAHA